MTTSRVREPFHFQETDLIETTGKNIDDVAVVSDSFGEVIIELALLAMEPFIGAGAYLKCFLIVLDIIAVDVVMRSDGLPELGADDHSRTFSRWSSAEQHNSATHIHKLGLQESGGHTEGNSGTSQGAFVTSNWPRIFLKLFERIGQLELALGHGQQESSAGASRAHGRPARLLLHWNAWSWT